MTTLEKARIEIEQEMSTKPSEFNQHDESNYDRGLFKALLIIDKYAEQEKNIKEIEEVINCDADAETKCKMISNILTAKPHYFEEQEPTSVKHDTFPVKLRINKVSKHISNFDLDELEQEPTIPCDLCGFNTGESIVFCEYLSACPATGKAVSK